MAQRVQDLRNIVFCGHGSAGKTTLTDKILTSTGTIKRPANVSDGTSICDFDEEEKAHHHSIESTLVHFDHAGKHFNLIDTPGYPDFIAQALGAMRAVDTAAIVIDAHAGMGVNTRRVFHEAGVSGLGRMIIINKMDADNVDYPAVLHTVQELFGKACLPFTVPLGHGHDFKGVASTLHPPAKAEGALVDPNALHEPVIEAIIEVDDEVTERYFEGKMPTDEEIARLLPQAIAAGSLIPVLAVSAKTGVGLAELLDALAQCALPPEVIQRTAKNEAGQDVPVLADPAGPLVAQIFKTRIDPF
ncbi:MAG TPA: GTP-binding protein, partial [Pirellulales bacterium]|nr:GTP-binding protein [Pirellulales bacterium]